MDHKIMFCKIFQNAPCLNTATSDSLHPHYSTSPITLFHFLSPCLLLLIILICSLSHLASSSPISLSVFVSLALCLLLFSSFIKSPFRVCFLSLLLLFISLLMPSLMLEEKIKVGNSYHSHRYSLLLATLLAFLPLHLI